MTEPLPTPQTYPDLLATLKARIRDARLRAAGSVNRQLILLYWEIGRDILLRQSAEGWGTAVIDRLARDLRRDFPDMTGLSPRNLHYMRAFAEAWADQAIVQQLVAQLPWGHNIRLLEALKQPVSFLLPDCSLALRIALEAKPPADSLAIAAKACSKEHR